MDTRIDEIAEDIFRLSTFDPDVGPTGFTYNQFLIRDEEPLLFHTGHRHLFPSVSEALSTVVPIEDLRWITFGHVEADECGSMNQFLAAAPNAEVAHGMLGVMVSIGDMADRAPLGLGDGQILELGKHRLRHIDTPHVPHGWEARVLFDETTSTLFCGDLMSRMGDRAVISDEDPLEGAGEAEDMFHATCLTPTTGATLRGLAALAPTTLAIMHGPSFSGDGAAALNGLADAYDARLAAAM